MSYGVNIIILMMIIETKLESVYMCVSMLVYKSLGQTEIYRRETSIV